MIIKLKLRPSFGATIFTIIIDDDVFLDIHSKIFGKTPSFTAKNTLEEFKEFFFEEEYKKAKKYILDRLASKSYPSTQLIKLLETNLVSAKSIDRIVADCKRYGYLNDDEWLENFVKSEVNKGVGPQKIFFKLKLKGVDVNDAEKYIHQYSNEDEILKVIHKLMITKYKRFDLKDYKQKSKVVNSLLRKGYSYDLINQSFEKVSLENY